MRTSGEIDFRFRPKLEITLLESTYPNQRTQCPSLSPHFLLTLLKYWQEYNHGKFSENSDIQNIIIWNNSHILIGGKPIFYKPLFQAQIISIKHLLNENNTFLLFDELKQKASISILSHFTMASSLPFLQNGKCY